MLSNGKTPSFVPAADSASDSENPAGLSGVERNPPSHNYRLLNQVVQIDNTFHCILLFDSVNWLLGLSFCHVLSSVQLLSASLNRTVITIILG